MGSAQSEQLLSTASQKGSSSLSTTPIQQLPKINSRPSHRPLLHNQARWPAGRRFSAASTDGTVTTALRVNPKVVELRILKKRPVGNPELLQTSVTFEVKRPVGCVRNFGIRACVTPVMFALTSILSLHTRQPFFAEPWGAYCLEYHNSGISPGRNTEAKNVCQKPLQGSHLLAPNHFECGVRKKTSGGSDCHKQCP